MTALLTVMVLPPQAVNTARQTRALKASFFMACLYRLAEAQGKFFRLMLARAQRLFQAVL
jgi:hypothetical protein